MSAPDPIPELFRDMLEALDRIEADLVRQADALAALYERAVYELEAGERMQARA